MGLSFLWPFSWWHPTDTLAAPGTSLNFFLIFKNHMHDPYIHMWQNVKYFDFLFSIQFFFNSLSQKMGARLPVNSAFLPKS